MCSSNNYYNDERHHPVIGFTSRNELAKWAELTGHSYFLPLSKEGYFNECPHSKNGRNKHNSKQSLDDLCLNVDNNESLLSDLPVYIKPDNWEESDDDLPVHTSPGWGACDNS